MIPAEAVEAAAKEIYRVAADLAYEADTWDDLSERQRQVWIDDAKRILEAAAPHMPIRRDDMDNTQPGTGESAANPAPSVMLRHPIITNLRDLNKLPAFSVIHIPHLNKTLERLSNGWYQAALETTFTAHETWLPATVLHVGES